MASGVRRKAPVVLFVEDCPEVCELHGIALQEAGLLVRVAHSIEAAREALSLVTPDVIVMDRDLPDGDGFAFACALREHATTRDVPLIAFTASPPRGAMDDAHAAGMHGFVAKPCPPAKLVALVRVLLAAPARDATARAC